MNIRSRFLMLTIFLLVIACTRSPREPHDSIPEAPSSGRRSDSAVIEGSSTTAGNSSSWTDRARGMIEVDLADDEPARFEVTLFAERGSCRGHRRSGSGAVAVPRRMGCRQEIDRVNVRTPP